MKTTILVVDDTDSCRRSMQSLLKSEGYATRTAVNGLEAFDGLQTFLPDLMLLDLSMPLMDGFELLARLRDTPRLAQLPVIVVTGEITPDCVARAIALGAREVLKKAEFTSEELLGSIRRELPAKRVQRTLELLPEKAETSIMRATAGDGTLCELVSFPDGSIGVTRDKIRVLSPRFTRDQLTECIELLYRSSGKQRHAIGNVASPVSV